MSNIEFVAWGTKDGEQKFFHTPTLDINSPEIANCIKDIRSNMAFTVSRVTFYAIEFSTNYKVFTLYHSIFDWANRDRGYLALTLFVPKNKKIKAPDTALDVLHKMLEIYKTNYIDDSYRLEKVRENQELFFDIIKKLQLENERGYKFNTWRSSENNDKIGLIRYSSDNELKAFFNNPFRKQFLSFQEIMFLKKDAVDERSMYQSGMEALEISPEDPEYRMTVEILDKDRNNITRDAVIRINGSIESPPFLGLKADDEVSIKINPKHYKPFIRKGFISDLAGSGSTTVSICHRMEPDVEKVKFALYDTSKNRLSGHGSIYINRDPVSFNGGTGYEDINPFEDYELKFETEGYDSKIIKKSGADIISVFNQENEYPVHLNKIYNKTVSSESPPKAIVERQNAPQHPNKRPVSQQLPPSQSKKLLEIWENYKLLIVGFGAGVVLVGLIFSGIKLFNIIFPSEKVDVGEITEVEKDDITTGDNDYLYQFLLIDEKSQKEVTDKKVKIVYEVGEEKVVDSLTYEVGGFKLTTTSDTISKIKIEVENYQSMADIEVHLGKVDTIYIKKHESEEVAETVEDKNDDSSSNAAAENKNNDLEAKVNKYKGALKNGESDGNLSDEIYNKLTDDEKVQHNLLRGLATKNGNLNICVLIDAYDSNLYTSTTTKETGKLNENIKKKILNRMRELLGAKSVADKDVLALARKKKTDNKCN